VPENIGAGEGNRTLVFSLEVSKYCNVFKGRSDIFAVFGLLRSLQIFPLSEWQLRAPWVAVKPGLRLYGNPRNNGGSACIKNTVLPPNTLASTTSRTGRAPNSDDVASNEVHERRALIIDHRLGSMTDDGRAA
jgi:hypothetical protein